MVRLYGSTELSTDVIPILDPKTHTVKNFVAPVRDADTPGCRHAARKPMQPSPYWGNEKVWKSKANNHNGMFDRNGRVWFAARVRGPNNPAFCKKGSDHPSAKAFPIERTNRHLTMLDPKTRSTRSSTLASGRIICSSAMTPMTACGPAAAVQVVGWLNMKIFDETGDRGESRRAGRR